MTAVQAVALAGISGAGLAAGFAMLTRPALRCQLCDRGGRRVRQLDSGVLACAKCRHRRLVAPEP